MKLLKIVFFTLLSLVIILIAGAYAAIHFIDMAQVKQMVQQKVEAQTGRQLVIAGDVEPTIGFMPTVAIYNVSLSNPSWAKSPDMVKVAKLRVSLELMPLLHREVRISNIQLEGAQIMLEKKGEQASWQFESKEQTETGSAAGESEAATTSGSLQIGELKVANSTVDYLDHGNGTHHQMAIQQLDMEDISQHGVGQLTAKGVYNGAALDITGSLSEDNLMLIDLMLKKGATSVLAKGSVALEDMTFDLAVEINAARIGELMAIAAMPSDNEAGLILKTALGGKPDMISFSGMTMRYDDIEMAGAGRIDLAGAVPYIHADIKIPEIKGDSGEAPLEDAAQAAKEQKPAEADAAIPDMPIPTDGLDVVNADIRVSAANIDAGGLVLKDMNAAINLENGKLAVSPFDMKTSQGWVKGSLTLDGSNEKPVLSADILSNDIVLGKLLEALSGDSAVSGGIVKSGMKIQAAGNTLHQMLNSANGSLNFYLDNASYRVPASAQKVEAFVNLLRGSGDRPDEIRLACAVGRFTINQGVANSELLAMKTGGAVVTGDGTFRLKDTVVNMILKARSGMAGLAAVVPPIRLQGPVASPSVIPDPQGTLLQVGRLALGMSGGSGLGAVLGEQTLDQLGVSGEEHPCLKEIAASQETTPQNPQEQYKQLEDTVREQRDQIKENLDIEKIEDDAKQLRDGLKGLFKKP